MIRHPSFSRLRRFARAGGVRRDGRTAEHLLACIKCRATVDALRAVIDVAHAAPAGAQRTRGFDDVAERLRRRDIVLLPTAAPVRARGRGARAARVAAALVLLAGLTFVLTRPAELGAMRSELTVMPTQPRAGEPLTLSYRATSLLSGEARLVVRGRLRIPTDAPHVERNVVLGTLNRARDGLYTGTFALPDSVVYAVLAIEHADGSEVDANGERWEVTVHGEADRPLVAALLQRAHDTNVRDTRLHQEAVAQLVALYPERPEGWLRMWAAEMQSLGHAAVDSLSAYHRTHHLPRLEAVLAADPAPDALALGAIVFYTRFIGAAAANARWKDVLYTLHPMHSFALGERAMDVHRAHRDVQERMAAYEALWAEAGPRASQLVVNALALAEQMGDAALIRLWGERMERTDDSSTRDVAMTFARHHELRALAVPRLQREIELALDEANARRGLRYTVTEYRDVREREASSLLFALGTLLLEEGDTAQARHALERAAATGWDARRFRALADVYLGLGDTATATVALARSVADPVTTAAFADSARVRLGPVPDAIWREAVVAARAAMAAHTRTEMIRRTPQRGSLRMLDAHGEQVEVQLAGAVTVLAFWSRYCPYSVDRLPALERTAAALRREGVRILIVTDDDDASRTAAFLQARGLTTAAASTLLDVERDAQNAVHARGYGSYFVLDAAGVIRFSGYSPETIARQVEALRQAGQR